MRLQSRLRTIHFASTGWFILCAVFILVLALRQAGFRWWVIFSLSGHSVLLLFLLISLYLFAMFKGIDRGQKLSAEHPLTSTVYYAVFYDVCPFLGALAGVVGLAGVGSGMELVTAIAMGTLGTTFLVWIIVDPLLWFCERLVPSSRRNRLERLAEVKALRRQRQRQQEELLAEILAQERQEKQSWQSVLGQQAQHLADLLMMPAAGGMAARQEAIAIGAEAWRTGGIGCMKLLHSMAFELCSRQARKTEVVDFISSWWDGIGSWRSVSVI